jgi:hypothetical protein
VDRLLELLGQAVQFAYTCWDRMVLSGYIERLQRPENLIWFFHDIVGLEAIDPAVLEQRTNAYQAWVRRTTDEHGIPVLAAPRGARKEELVEPYYRRLKRAEGVACVLTSMEQGRTFARGSGVRMDRCVLEWQQLCERWLSHFNRFPVSGNHGTELLWRYPGLDHVPDGQCF